MPAGADGTAGPVDPVDPYDAARVAEVVAGTARLMGTPGVHDLLARLPGVRVEPGTPKRLLRPAVDGGTWVGPEHLLTRSDPVVHRHEVGGVVLRSAVVPPADLPGLVARLVATLTREQGSREETSAVLTAAAEVLDRL